MPLSAYPELPAGVVLCIDDNQDVLECEKAFLEDLWVYRSDRTQWPQGAGTGFHPFG